MSPRDTARAVTIFTVAVILSVAIALAGLTWRVAALWQAPAPMPVASPVAIGPATADVGPILAFAPFGRPDGASAPPTSLALELRGVVMAIPSSRSSVLIAPTGGTPVAYMAGQSVPGGTIESIALDAVLLRVNGRLEKLAFPRPSAVPATTPATQPVLGPSDAVPMQVIPSPAPAPASLAPQSLLDSIGASPEAGGYKVGATPSPAARRAGLIAGDVIETINGMPAGQVASDSRLMAAAAASGTAQIAVMRAGKRITMSFPLR